MDQMRKSHLCSNKLCDYCMKNAYCNKKNGLVLQPEAGLASYCASQKRFFRMMALAVVAAEEHCLPLCISVAKMLCSKAKILIHLPK